MRLPMFVISLLVCTAVMAGAAVPPMISYQGRLMQPSGAPVPDGTYSMVFAIYDAPTGGVPLWSETNPGVQVKGGLFAAILGSVINLPANIFDSQNRFFGVKVGSDSEMTPRQQVASVAFAEKAASADQATTVPDASITTSKVAIAAITTDRLAPGAVTVDKLASGVAIPPGTILMWSGSTSQVPQGWALCNGQNGTPDLRDRFIVGAGSGYSVGATGGASQVTLTTDQMPSHNHSLVTPEGIVNWGGNPVYAIYDNSHAWSGEYMHRNANPTTNSVGGGQPHENRPPYYALCFIMKLAY